MTDYGYIGLCNYNKSDRTLILGSNYLHFTGLDDPEKIKSTEWNDIYMEEMTDFSFDDYVMLSLRCRAPGHFNQLFGAFNPIDEQGWINQKVILKEDSVEVIHSTYKDNPFFPEEEARKLERLKEIDENYHKIYALGEWGGIIKGRIFTYDIYEDNLPYEWVSYGIDFGFTNDPSTIIRVSKRGDELWLQECIYETGLTNQDLSIKLSHYCQKTDEIIADSAEPKSIQEIFIEGWNIHPAKKGKDSIRHGIDLMKRYKLHIHKDSLNLQKEFNQYRWAVNKNGDIVKPEKPIDFLNHAIDAVRYVCLNKLAPKKTLHFA